jgi:hypothetical protein
MEMSDINAPIALIPAQFSTPFCDEAVAPEVATALRQSAERIRRLGEEQTEAILAIRRELIAVKELLPFDQFGPWIRKEFGMTDETAAAYVGAARKIAADPASCKKSLRPKLISWHPDRARESGACGFAEVELPSGVTLACPVFADAPISPYFDAHQPEHVLWPEALYPHEFNDDILAQIREVDPGAFEDHSTPTIATEAPGSTNNGIGGENSPGGDSR